MVNKFCMNKGGILLAAGLLLCATAGGVRAQQQAEKKDMELVGYNDLQARSAYQPVINEQNGRWIAYIGHHGGASVNPLTGAKEVNGTSIVDVTDPKHPKYLHHIPGGAGKGEGGGAQMVRVCNGRDLPKGDRGKVYMLRTLGNVAHQIWDVTTPESPALLTTVADKLVGTHKSWWECDTGIAYLVSGVPGWKARRMTQVFDLSDPAKPVFIRNFGLPGQEPTAAGTSPYELHGPISTGPRGNRVYFGYGTVKNGYIQIVDREKLLNGPKEPTPENLRYPQIAGIMTQPSFGAHTTLPIFGLEIADFAKNTAAKKRDILVVVNESTSNECREPRQLAYFVDITDEKAPFGFANFQVRESSGDFCSRGGRFGAHSSNEHQAPMYARRIVFITWFNAGVRAVDIRDPFNPREIGYYIPAITDKTDKRCVKAADGERCKIAIQTNNVEVDDRGYIYIVDRANTGMHILELAGDARKMANFR
ncbi:MAG TPA: hypothetical protein VLT92_05745 [Burkholderiales bacterium]|nr:hypothetical protein [Burkholderiales bacterium]